MTPNNSFSLRETRRKPAAEPLGGARRGRPLTLD